MYELIASDLSYRQGHCGWAKDSLFSLSLCLATKAIHFSLGIISVKTDKIYYIWDDNNSEFNIKLGMSKSKLISSGYVTEIVRNQEKEYIGKNGFPWRIKFKNERVEQIWFNNDYGFTIKGKDVYSLEMDNVLNFLNSHFEQIPELIKNKTTLWLTTII